VPLYSIRPIAEMTVRPQEFGEHLRKWAFVGKGEGAKVCQILFAGMVTAKSCLLRRKAESNSKF
jgi:hypothetical protein